MVDSAVQSLRSAIDEAIGKSGEVVIGRVKSHYVDAEVKRRSEMLLVAVNLHREAELDLRKIDKPDHQLFNADGSVATQQYTKGKLDEIKKARERIDRLDTAVDAVLASHDKDISAQNDAYKKLDEAVKKSGKGAKSSEAE